MSKLEKDEERAKRLKEVYRYLFSAYGLESQSDFANNIKVQRTAMSAAMNGAKAYLTNNLFTKICAAYPGVFNLDYLLNGEGELLANSEQKDGDVNVDPGDYMAKYIASLEKQVKDKDQQIADLRRDIQLLYKRLNIESRYESMQANLFGGIAAGELQEPAHDND